ncbi:uncharacterized protein ACO6RY_03184 [Pungitius sinensis]|jgi:hypothetical protein
MSLQ